jgi:hypothetical protein
MDVKEAVRLAKAYVRDTFADEKILDVGLEETQFEEPAGQWIITVGFRRPFDRKVQLKDHFSIPGLPQPYKSYENRVYKTVLIDAKTGQVASMRDLVLRSAA